MTDIIEEATAPLGETLPPLLRGWLHFICAIASIPAGILVIASAGSTRSRVAATVYAFGMTAMFTVSALYHRRRWSAAARRRMRRLDHGTIFVMIAGSYTPLCLLALRGTTATAILVGVWIGAGVGFLFALTGFAEKALLGLLCYILLGWVMVLALPQLSHQLGSGQIGLLFAGGIVYTVGGAVLATRWPNPAPTVFGYHEVWHTMVAAACVCHYLIILSVVRHPI